MKLLIVTNIPAPYRLDFFNELGKYCDLTVLFEAERNYALNKAWYTDKITNFKAEFLKRGAIEEKKVNPAIFKFLKNNKFDKIITDENKFSVFPTSCPFNIHIMIFKLF